MDAHTRANNPEFNPKRYDFIEVSHDYEVHENYEDMIEDKIFKYKYRQNADDPNTYMRRQVRVMNRFWERSKTRDTAIETDLIDLHNRDSKDTSLASFFLDQDNYKDTIDVETLPIRENMAREAVQ